MKKKMLFVIVKNDEIQGHYIVKDITFLPEIVKKFCLTYLKFKYPEEGTPIGSIEILLEDCEVYE